MKLLVKELRNLNGYHGTIDTSEEMKISNIIEILQKTVLQQYQVEDICLVAKGRLLKPPYPLYYYNLDTNSRILILKKTFSKKQLQKFQDEYLQFEKQNMKIERIKKAAEKLSERVDGGNKKEEAFFFQLEDQNGEEVKLPKNDRKNLVLGLTFYNKGKLLYTNKKYEDAIEYYLLSEEAFNRCSEYLLGSIDNFAYLNLDIVWCYYKLKNFDKLKESKDRLYIAEKLFKQIHGENLQILKKVKGDNLPEYCLYFKLHFLQGILNFYFCNFYESKHFFNDAKDELSFLDLDEDQVLYLKNMGFSEKESKRALKACHKNLDKSIQRILVERELKKEKRK